MDRLASEVRGPRDERLKRLLALGDRAYLLAVRVLGTRQGAEDAVQQAYLNAAGDLRKGARPQRLDAWFLGAVANAARKQLRTEIRRRRRETSVMREERQDRSGHEKLERSEMVVALRTAIAALEDKYRAPLSLCCEQGMSQREAAEVLSMPESTVSKYVNAGLERLKRALDTGGFAATPALLLANLKLTGGAAPAALTAAVESIVAAVTLPAAGAAGAGAGAAAKAAGLSLGWKSVAAVSLATMAAAGTVAALKRSGGARPAGKLPANAWVKTPDTQEFKKLKHFAEMISGRPKAKTSNWRFQKYRAVYSSSAQGAWIPPRKSVLFVSGNSYSGPTTWLYDPAVGGDWNRKLAGREQPKGWTDLKVGKDIFKGGFLWTSMCWDPVNKEVLLFGGNCAEPGGSPGTMTFDLAKKTWTRLDFSTSPLAKPHAECEALRLAARKLEGRMRSRWHLGETAEEAKADLGKPAKQLAAKVSKLLGALPSGAGEKECVARARPEFSAAAEALGALDGSVAPDKIARAAGAAERLRAARDFLAPEPTARAHSQLAWDAKQKKIFLFGGDRLDYLMADTWVYDPKTRRWRQKFPKTSPAPRAGHALVWLPKSEKLAMLGGYAYRSDEGYGGMGYTVREPELWVYDTGANKWGLLKHWLFGKNRHGIRSAREGIEGGGPASPHNKALEAVASDDDVILCEGWACRVDPGAIDAAGTAKYGVKPGTIARRSGKYVPTWWDEGAKSAPAASEKFLKSIPANAWVRVTPPKVLKRNRDWGTATFDTDRGQILYFSGGHCGYSGTDVHVYSSRANRWRTSSFADFPVGFCAGTGYHGQRWSFTGRPFMTSHTYKLYAYDPKSRKMLLYNRGDTFIFDPLTCDWEWPPVKVTPFGGGHWIPKFCTTPDGVLVWSTLKGRTRDRPSGLWRFDPAARAWRKIKTSGEKVPTTPSDDYGTMVWDSKRKRALMFVTSRKPGGPWSCDPATGAVKNLKAPAPKSGPDQPREAIYLPSADVVLFAQTKGEKAIVYDCARNKYRLLALKNPLKRKQHSYGLMYDPKRGLAWVVQCTGSWPIHVMRFDPKTAKYADGK